MTSTRFLTRAIERLVNTISNKPQRLNANTENPKLSYHRTVQPRAYGGAMNHSRSGKCLHMMACRMHTRSNALFTQKNSNTLRKLEYTLAMFASVALFGAAITQDNPNFLVACGDDIGNTYTSANTLGPMGRRTPDIDRFSNEGMRFAVYSDEQYARSDGRRSSTARASIAAG
jgi:hypothetical protein